VLVSANRFYFLGKSPARGQQAFQSQSHRRRDLFSHVFNRLDVRIAAFHRRDGTSPASMPPVCWEIPSSLPPLGCFSWELAVISALPALCVLPEMRLRADTVSALIHAATMSRRRHMVPGPRACSCWRPKSMLVWLSLRAHRYLRRSIGLVQNASSACSRIPPSRNWVYIFLARRRPRAFSSAESSPCHPRVLQSALVLGRRLRHSRMSGEQDIATWATCR